MCLSFHLIYFNNNKYMTKRAILIGSNYINTANQLDGCINDINNIQNFLINMCGYINSNITILLNNNASDMNIQNIIKQILKVVIPGDTIFFYYSGHGATVTGSSSNEKPEADDAIIPNDYTTGGYITDDWLYNNFIIKIPSKVTLWGFTDCCHSGTMFDLKYNWLYTPSCTIPITNNMNYIDNQWLNTFSVNIINSNETLGDVFLISGCQDSQTSADTVMNNQPCGALTFCFLKFIQNHTSNFRSILIADMLKEIICYLVIYGFEQRPQLSIGKQSDFNVNFNP